MASAWSNVSWQSEVPSLGAGRSVLMSIGKGNSLPMAATEHGISVPSAGVEFQAYVAKITPRIHKKKFPKSAVLMVLTLLRTRWKCLFHIRW